MAARLIDQLMELWTSPLADRADPEADFARLYADPTIINGTPMSVRDLVARAAALQAAFPDRTTEVVDTIETPGQVAVAFVLRATHLGTFHSPMGPVEPTGQPVEVRTIDVLTITDDRIAKIWVVSDDLTMLRQLDAVRLA